MTTSKFFNPIAAYFALITLTVATSAMGVTPPTPANTNGDGNPNHNGMKHAAVSRVDSAIEVHVADMPPSPVTMMSGHGIDYTPGKFDVLENVYFNAQHGWMPDGIFNLPAGAAIWIERTGASIPSGATFRVYEAGNMMQGMNTWTMTEIYSNDGFRWQWDGLMQHDYFTADLPGQYAMSFRVYVGDGQGAPLTSFSSADVTFQFQAVPEPTTSSLWGIAMAVVAWLGRQRRR